MITCLKGELRYLLYSKVFFVVLLVLILSLGVACFINYSDTLEMYSEYNWRLERAIEEGEDVETLLTEGFEVTTENAGFLATSTQVMNPLPYFKQMFEQKLFASSPKYAVTQATEVYIILLPFIFGIFGMMLGAYEYGNRIIKVKGVRFSRSQLMVSKHLGLFIVTLTAFLIPLVISPVMAGFAYTLIGQTIDVQAHYQVFALNSVGMKLFYSWALGFLFAETGFTLGLLFRRVSPGIVILVAYLMFLPPLGKFDPKSALDLLGSKIYDFLGSVSMAYNPQNVGVTGSILILGVLLVAFVLTSVWIQKSRSQFY